MKKYSSSSAKKTGTDKNPGANKVKKKGKTYSSKGSANK
jgi:hypothetical protein